MMLSLPPLELNDEVGQYQLVLPCPAFEFIQLLAWQHRGSSQLNLAQQLYGNPAMLLYAALTFQGSESVSARSAGALSHWFASCVPEILQHVQFQIGDSADSFSVDEASPTRYVFAGSNRLLAPLRRYVASLSRADVTGPARKKLIRKFLVRSILVPQARAKHLLSGLPDQLLVPEPSIRFPSRDKRSTRLELACRWRDIEGDREVLQGLMQLYRAHNRQQAEFEGALQREKLASLQQLAYGASHEINNPLANIASRAQSLLTTEPSLERRSKLAVIYEQALRSHEMISDLMLFANPPTVQLTRIDLREFLRRLIRQMESKLSDHRVSSRTDHRLKSGSSYGSAAAANGSAAAVSASPEPIRLIVRVAPNLETLNCDETQLSVALIAMLQNSLESILGSHGSTIELRVAERQDMLRFEIQDDGRGVPESSARHLFDPFYSGREAGRGLGFGLSKAWRIAQLHGGRLDYDSSHTCGAKFVLEINR